MSLFEFVVNALLLVIGSVAVMIVLFFPTILYLFYFREPFNRRVMVVQSFYLLVVVGILGVAIWRVI